IRALVATTFLIALFSCNEHNVQPTPGPLNWQATDVKFDGRFLGSFSFDNKLLLATKTSLMSVDKDLNMTELLNFEPTAWDSPDPILNNNIYVCRTLKDTVINGVGGGMESATIHMNDLQDGSKGTINMTRVLHDIALDQSESWEFYIATP